MNEVEKLEYLSLVSKVCTELENHLGMNDKDLAEFIIHLSEENNTLDSFKKALIENGAEFSDSFMSNLLRIIQHMRPKKGQSKVEAEVIEKDALAYKFPGLAIPNEPQKPLQESNFENENKEEKNIQNQDTDVVADLMAQFEAQAPSSIDKKEEKKGRVREESSSPGTQKRKKRGRETSRSPSRRKRSRSRSNKRKSRRDRSRSRSRERDSKRNKDKEIALNRRSRSREHRRYKDRRERSRSRDRRERSRSRGKRRERSLDKKIRNDRHSPELDDDPIPGKVGTH